MLVHEPVSLVRVSIDFGSLACCHWTAENVDHILELGDKMNLDSFQEELIPDTETQSPFRCALGCREQQSDRLADITNKNTRNISSAHFGTN